MPSIEVEQEGTLRPDQPLAAEPLPDSTVRIRRRRQEASEAMVDHADQDEDNTRYLALPGIVCVSKAMLVVSITGACNSQTWRKNQI